MLEIKNLTKYYKKLKALDSVDATIEEQKITVLLGPNGAGKSTLIKSVLGFLNYEGTILVDGTDVHDLEIKKQIAYIPEIPELYDQLTVYQHLQFLTRAYRVELDEQKVEYYLQLFHLSDKKDSMCSTLSKGMKQKVSILCALCLQPKILLIDEPFIGLDPDAIHDFRNLLVELKQECLILISTHLLESVQQIWDTVLIMNNGRLVYQSNRDEVESIDTLEAIYFAYKGGDNNGSISTPM